MICILDPGRARPLAMHPRTLLGLAACLIASTAPGPGGASRFRADEVADLVTKLKADTDTAEPKLIQELAGKRTREAMDGLLEVYDAMHTIYMRREVVRALARR